MSILAFPHFSPITANMHNELYPFLNNDKAGISEFTFLSLSLHQKKYNYLISSLGEKSYVLHGNDKDGSFFCTLGRVPPIETIQSLLEEYRRWKLVSQENYELYKEALESKGYNSYEDRNNADYLYLREKLASLSGKSLHKKRNLANNFEKNYDCKVLPLNEQTASDAGEVLDLWQATRTEGLTTDYEQCFFALSLLTFSELEGWIVYANSKPVGWALGEFIADKTMFVVHFEKGLDEYKGVYQYVNRATALSLPESVVHINREQDLGDEGLRQAKMTYRPVGFVQKYVIKKA